MNEHSMPTPSSMGCSLDEPLPGVAEPGSFERELQELINRHSVENDSNTPDMILRGFMVDSLNAFNRSVRQRDQWYGVKLQPGSGSYVGSDGGHHQIVKL